MKLFTEWIKNPVTVPKKASDMEILHLTREKGVMILVAKGSEARRDKLTNYHFQSKLLKRVKLYTDNDIFIVPL